MPFYLANNSYNSSLTADYTAGDATLSVSTLPTNTPTIVTVARGTTKETRFTVTGAGAGLLTGVARLDGASENISSGVSVECMIDEDFVNQLESAVYVQAGLKSLVYAADGGASDTYAITLAVAPSALADITGLPIAFKANTINTGAATLNVNSLGAKTIKKNYNEDLTSGDIKANQIMVVVYDGTNFQLIGNIFSSTRSVSIQVVAGTTDTATGDGKFYFSIPAELNGANLTGVFAAVVTAGTTGTTDIQIANVTQAADMLTTKLTIDSAETTSATAATPAVIDTANDDVATNDLLRIDVDAVSTTAAKGLIVRLTFGF